MKLIHLFESYCTEKKQSYEVLNNKWQKIIKHRKFHFAGSEDTVSKSARYDDMKLQIPFILGKFIFFCKLKGTPKRTVIRRKLKSK